MRNHHGYDLFDQKILEDYSNRMKVQKNMTVNDLHEFVAKNMVGTSIYKYTHFRI